MKVSELRKILNSLPYDMEVSVQLPTDDPPVDFVVDADNFIADGDIIIFPIPWGGKGMWDHEANTITTKPIPWYTLDENIRRLEGEG